MGRLAALLPRSLKALSAGAALWCGSAPALANEVVRLELVLAVDCSSIVNLDEFTLQMEGIAGAFADPRVLAALAQTVRSDQHTSELPSLMRNSYSVFCLTNKT